MESLRTFLVSREKDLKSEVMIMAPRLDYDGRSEIRILRNNQIIPDSGWRVELS